MGDREVPLHRLSRVLGSALLWTALAFGLRAAFAWALGERLYQADELGYTNYAKSLVGWGVLGKEGAAQVTSPVAPAFFGLFLLLGGSVFVPRLAQAAVSAATAWMIGRMTADLTGSRRAGRFALAVSAVYPFFVYYSGMLMTETLYLAGLVGGLWAVCRSLHEKGAVLWRAGAAGAAFAAAGLTRTEGVPLALILWGGVLVLCALKRYAWRAWAVAVLVWLVPLFGWAARNKTVCGHYALDTHGGITLLHGTLLFEMDQMDTTYSQQAFELTPLYRESEGMGEYDRDRLFFRTGLRFMRDNPGVTVRQWAHKLVNFWRLYPRMDKVYPDTGTARPGVGAKRWMLVVVSLLFEPLLIFAGFYGVWLLRGRAWTLFPLYWAALGTCAAHVVVTSQMRYRLPLMPLFILFACAAAARYLKWGEE